MRCCGLNTNEPWLISRIASERVHGGNVHWVLREFPRELYACRQRQARARTLLIVVVDADGNSIEKRYRELTKALEGAELKAMDSSDPAAILIPKRHIETWIRVATGHDANESDSYKHPPPTKDQVAEAARLIHGWPRDAPKPDQSCVVSLLRAFSEWRKIG
jgi:hypothetical protein